MSKTLAFCFVLNGKAHMLRDCGNATVVLSERPRAAAFPCEPKSGMGIQSQLSARAARNARTCLVQEEGANVQGGSATLGTNGRAAPFRNSPRMGRKSES